MGYYILPLSKAEQQVMHALNPEYDLPLNTQVQNNLGASMTNISI